MTQTRTNFFMVANEIFTFSLTTKAIAVYCCLCRHADVNTHTCFPSRKTIAKECSLGVSSVDRAIDELCQHGLICKIHRRSKDGGKTSNYYTLAGLITHPRTVDDTG